MSEAGLKIALIGSRGIPANYGGFETFAERLSVGLVKKGHEVSVYCTSAYNHNQEPYYKGVHRHIVPTISIKSIDKIGASFLSCLHSTVANYHIILFLGVSPVLFSWIPRVFGKKTVINIDGLEWKRQKWNQFGSFYLKLSESLSGKLCNEVVTDSRAIQRYYKNAYGRDSCFIAYGADIRKIKDENVLRRFGLKKNNYFLQVCRLDPENNAHIVIREFAKIKTEMPLVILGSAPYSAKYIESLKKISDRRVRFLGGVYGYNYNVIRSNPFCYIHAHEVGGTNPALLEALAAGNCVLVLDVPYNLEVIGDVGLSFSKEEGSLAKRLQSLVDNPELANPFKHMAVERIREFYTWDKVIDQYERLFFRLLE
jgi:glycosyltransferase involved in cell wall biosynthesis